MSCKFQPKHISINHTNIKINIFHIFGFKGNHNYKVSLLIWDFIAKDIDMLIWFFITTPCSIENILHSRLINNL